MRGLASHLAIRLQRNGCSNRPFYNIVVMNRRQWDKLPIVEQVGSFDPLPNKNDEKLVAFNFERIRHWMAQGASVSTPVLELLGLSGFLPIHPRTYMTAWRNRKEEREKLEQMKEQQTEQCKAESASS